MDWYFSQKGDLALTPSGDIATTDSGWRDDSQQAYIRIMTEPGDFTLYPNFGAQMSRLYGMPQTPRTADLGKDIIMSALQREGRFHGRVVNINAVPTGPQTIRFDVFIKNNSRNNLILSIEQSLGGAQ